MAVRTRGAPSAALGSHAAAFSFCQDKILPTGEGGMLVLDDDAAHERAWDYKDHGKSLTRANDPAFAGAGTSYRWLVDSFGSNWRMDEMSAAVGRVGLRALPQWHEARTKNAHRLADGLEETRGLLLPMPREGTIHAFYRLYARVVPEDLTPGWTRDLITAAIVAEGVPVQYGSCAELYREEAFVRAGLGPAERFAGASFVHETSVAFFVHPTLGDGDIDDTIAAVRRVMAVAAR